VQRKEKKRKEKKRKEKVGNFITLPLDRLIVLILVITIKVCETD
jgi:hypothetical protein